MRVSEKKRTRKKYMLLIDDGRVHAHALKSEHSDGRSRPYTFGVTAAKAAAAELEAALGLVARWADAPRGAGPCVVIEQVREKCEDPVVRLKRPANGWV